ncbi:MAG: ABC transporter permease, partial [Hyphomicrobiaceae bacterium]|nr:ABC transporter permease [Hyphomicrobiaceae bacterium]
ATGGDPVIFITLRDAQKLQFELAPPAARIQMARGQTTGSTDTINAVIARVHANASPDRIAASVRRWKHLSAITQAEQEVILTRSVVNRARQQIGMFTVLLLAVTAVVISLIIYTMTMEKLKQIATLKLIGAPDRTIVLMIIQQALALGVVGFTSGAILVLAVKDFFPRRVVLEFENVALLACVVVVICLLASLIGVRAALKVDPATAIGG